MHGGFIMKKILSLIMCLVMVFGMISVFSSCAKQDGTDAPADDKQEGTNATAGDDGAAVDGDDGAEDDDVLVCGVTIFENMNDQEADGTWTGFESDFAREVGKIIGMDVEFQIIDWNQKYNELNSGAIDCIWNGFTANSDDNGVKRSDLVDFSYGYMLNQQCVVINKNYSDIKSEADLEGKVACVEGGSAGEAYASTVTDNIITHPAQINAFTEVNFGAVDFAVVDIILAQNLCGKGDYADLEIVDSIKLESEIYAVGFKKGSPLTAKVNAAIKELEENGKLMELAEKYGFENVLQVTENIEF